MADYSACIYALQPFCYCLHDVLRYYAITLYGWLVVDFLMQMNIYL